MESCVDDRAQSARDLVYRDREVIITPELVIVITHKFASG
jgi:hypothetical protein